MSKWIYRAPYEPAPQKEQTKKSEIQTKKIKEVQTLDFDECEKWRESRDVYAPIKFGEALTWEVNKLNCTRYRIAKSSNISASNLGHYCMGFVRPKIETFERLKKAMFELWEEENGRSTKTNNT